MKRSDSGMNANDWPAMGPIYYERFWTIKYPVLEKLE